MLDDQSVLGDHPLFGSSFWGAADDWEQVEALKAASDCSCEVGLSEVRHYFDQLQCIEFVVRLSGMASEAK